MHQPTGKRKSRLIPLLILVLAALGVAAGLFFFNRLEKKADVVPANAGTAVSRQEAEEKEAIYYNGQKYMPDKDLSTLLIMGIDDPELVESGNIREKSQADFILLAVFDPKTETCQMLQINRDSMCDIPIYDDAGKNIGSRKEQIALSHTYGSSQKQRCENTVKAASDFLYGIPIDNYFAITMDGIPILNDLVGGVTVTVEDDFSGVDDTLVKGEKVRLTAENVEHFVRSRTSMKDDSSNIARMRRQRTYMTALFQALGEAYKKDSNFVIKAYDAITNSLVSDCTIDQMNDYAALLSDYQLSEIISPEGEAKLGETYMEFYADETALQQLVIDTFYQKVEE